MKIVPDIRYRVEVILETPCGSSAPLLNVISAYCFGYVSEDILDSKIYPTSHFKYKDLIASYYGYQIEPDYYTFDIVKYLFNSGIGKYAAEYYYDIQHLDAVCFGRFSFVPSNTTLFKYAFDFLGYHTEYIEGLKDNLLALFTTNITDFCDGIIKLTLIENFYNKAGLFVVNSRTNLIGETL